MLLYLLDLVGVGHGQQFTTTQGLRVRVETHQNTIVLEWVLALRKRTLDNSLASGTHYFLNLVRVDEAREISVGDDGVRERVVLFQGGADSVRAVQRVKQLEGVAGPDDETADMATRCELQNVERVDGCDFDTGDVAERFYQAIVLVVDDERATALGVAAVTELAETGAQLLGALHFFNVLHGVEAGQEGDGVLCFLERLDGVFDYERDLLDLVDAVAAGHDEGSQRRGSHGRAGGKAALVEVYLDVPLAEHFGGGKHAAAAAHVAKRGLASAVGAAARHTRDTRHGTPGAP